MGQFFSAGGAGQQLGQNMQKIGGAMGNRGGMGAQPVPQGQPQGAPPNLAPQQRANIPKAPPGGWGAPSNNLMGTLQRNLAMGYGSGPQQMGDAYALMANRMGYQRPDFGGGAPQNRAYGNTKDMKENMNRIGTNAPRPGLPYQGTGMGYGPNANPATGIPNWLRMILGGGQ